MKTPTLLLILSMMAPIRTLAIQPDSRVERLEILKIGSEFYPDQTYTLGFEVDPDRKALLAVYYQDPYPDAQTPYKRFPVETLSQPRVMIRAKNQYDVVKISMSGKSMTVHFRKDVREDRWSSKRFEVECTSGFGGCGVFDPSTRRYVTRAYITAHKALILGVFEKAVGIEAILTQ
jgi:hypothetical protein